MCTITRSCLLAFGAVLLLTAEDAAWKKKPIAQWDDKDVQQVLSASPWCKSVKLDQVRDLSPDERRASGNWEADQGHGVGIAGTGILGPTKAREARARAHAHPDPGYALIRWESALPVRSAEVRAGEAEVPNWKGDYYAIAIYGVSVPSRWNVENELKGIAYLQRDKKKNMKPVHVDIMRHDDGLATLVYLFSRSNEITRKDSNIRFVAQIDRLVISEFFFPSEMEFEGQPEF